MNPNEQAQHDRLLTLYTITTDPDEAKEIERKIEFLRQSP